MSLSSSEQSEVQSLLRPVFQRIAKGDEVAKNMWYVLAGLRSSDGEASYDETSKLRGAIFKALTGNVPTLSFAETNPSPPTRDIGGASHHAKYHGRAYDAVQSLGLLAPRPTVVKGKTVITDGNYVLQRGDVVLFFDDQDEVDDFIAGDDDMTPRVWVVRGSAGQTLGSNGDYTVVIPNNPIQTPS